MNFPAKTPEQQKMYVDDDTFFAKTKVREGTRFVNVGMRGQGERWTVTRVVSHRTTSVPGQFRSETVEEVRYLTDLVEMRSDDGRKRKTTFSHLRYSSTWRLA